MKFDRQLTVSTP